MTKNRPHVTVKRSSPKMNDVTVRIVKPGSTIPEARFYVFVFVLLPTVLALEACNSNKRCRID